MGPPKEGSRLRKPIPPFQAFLDAHRTAVYRFLMVSVGPNEADECFQETFLSALRAYPRLRDGSNLRGWVLAIATRKAIDAARARNRRALPVADPADEAPAALAVEAADPPDDDLWKAVAGLPVRQRMAVVHRFVLDESYAEIGAAMGSTEEAARANVYQALKKLREVEPR